MLQTIVKRAVLYKELDEHIIPLMRKVMRKQQLAKGWSDKIARVKFDK